MKHRLRPHRSVSLPPGIMRAAITSKNTVIATCTPCTVVSRSLLMSVIITFMFEPAKLQMNCASASGTRIFRREPDGRPTLTRSAMSRNISRSLDQRDDVVRARHGVALGGSYRATRRSGTRLKIADKPMVTNIGVRRHLISVGFEPSRGCHPPADERYDRSPPARHDARRCLVFLDDLDVAVGVARQSFLRLGVHLRMPAARQSLHGFVDLRRPSSTGGRRRCGAGLRLCSGLRLPGLGAGHDGPPVPGRSGSGDRYRYPWRSMSLVANHPGSAGR